MPRLFDRRHPKDADSPTGLTQPKAKKPRILNRFQQQVRGFRVWVLQTVNRRHASNDGNRSTTTTLSSKSLVPYYSLTKRMKSRTSLVSQSSSTQPLLEQAPAPRLDVIITCDDDATVLPFESSDALESAGNESVDDSTGTRARRPSADVVARSIPPPPNLKKEARVSRLSDDSWCEESLSIAIDELIDELVQSPHPENPPSSPWHSMPHLTPHGCYLPSIESSIRQSSLSDSSSLLLPSQHTHHQPSTIDAPLVRELSIQQHRRFNSVTSSYPKRALIFPAPPVGIEQKAEVVSLTPLSVPSECRLDSSRVLLPSATVEHSRAVSGEVLRRSANSSPLLLRPGKFSLKASTSQLVVPRIGYSKSASSSPRLLAPKPAFGSSHLVPRLRASTASPLLLPPRSGTSEHIRAASSSLLLMHDSDDAGLRPATISPLLQPAHLANHVPSSSRLTIDNLTAVHCRSATSSPLLFPPPTTQLVPNNSLSRSEASSPLLLPPHTSQLVPGNSFSRSETPSPLLLPPHHHYPTSHQDQPSIPSKNEHQSIQRRIFNSITYIPSNHKLKGNFQPSRPRASTSLTVPRNLISNEPRRRSMHTPSLCSIKELRMSTDDLPGTLGESHSFRDTFSGNSTTHTALLKRVPSQGRAQSLHEVRTLKRPASTGSLSHRSKKSVGPPLGSGVEWWPLDLGLPITPSFKPRGTVVAQLDPELCDLIEGWLELHGPLASSLFKQDPSNDALQVARTAIISVAAPLYHRLMVPSHVSYITANSDLFVDLQTSQEIFSALDSCPNLDIYLKPVIDRGAFKLATQLRRIRDYDTALVWTRQYTLWWIDAKHVCPGLAPFVVPPYYRVSRELVPLIVDAHAKHPAVGAIVRNTVVPGLWDQVNGVLVMTARVCIK